MKWDGEHGRGGHSGTRRANGGARPSLARHYSPQRQHHHGEAHGLDTRSVGGDKIAEALHARRSEAKGARRASGAARIAAEDLNRRRVAVQMRHISPAAMAGVGRNNSAKGRRRVRRHSSRVRVRTRARCEGVSDRPLGSVGPELV